MRALTRLAVAVCLIGFVCSGCARHTYYVELTDGKSFYVDPPLALDSQKGVYHMWIAGTRRTIPMDNVRYLDDAAQICYQNGLTDTFTCFDALYQF